MRKLLVSLDMWYIRQKRNIFYRNKASFPMHRKKMVMDITVLSVLDYIVHRTASASILKTLDSVYHSALQFITGVAYRTHLYFMLEGTLFVWREINCLLLIYQALIRQMPLYITYMLTVNNGLYQTLSSDFITLQVSWVFTEFNKSAFN